MHVLLSFHSPVHSLFNFSLRFCPPRAHEGQLLLLLPGRLLQKDMQCGQFLLQRLHIISFWSACTHKWGKIRNRVKASMYCSSQCCQINAWNGMWVTISLLPYGFSSKQVLTFIYSVMGSAHVCPYLICSSAIYFQGFDIVRLLMRNLHMKVKQWENYITHDFTFV